MKLNKIHYRPVTELDPFSEKLAQKKSHLKTAFSLLFLVLLGVLIYFVYQKNDWLHLYVHSIFEYFVFCYQKFLALSLWHKFLLIAPALLLDTTRYYLTNFFVFICVLFNKIFQKTKAHPYVDPAQCPFVTVIIPVYNEAKTIRHTIESILANNYPHYEVLLVDDCSTDQTPIICKKYQKEGKIRYLRKSERGGKPAVLNYGLKFAKGEIVIHFDGDSIFYRDTIYEAVKPFVDPKVGAVAGNLKVMNDRASWPARMQAAEYGICISVQRRWLSKTDTLQIASGAFGCFRKEILMSLQGTDPEVGEDSDITLKVRKMGYKVVFVEKAISFTEVPDTWKMLYKQRILWDRCYIRVNLRKHFNIANLKEFRFGDFLAVLTDLIFNLVLLLVFPIYIGIILFYYREFLLYIITVTYVYYTFMNILQMFIVVFLSENPKRDAVFILYGPLMFLYSNYLRFIRIHAYLLEIFRSKRYKKGYFPDKIWKSMPEYW